MKNLYLSYVRNSKLSGSGDVRKISIMRRCVIELYKLDLKSAYQCAFVYITGAVVYFCCASDQVQFD